MHIVDEVYCRKNASRSVDWVFSNYRPTWLCGLIDLKQYLLSWTRCGWNWCIDACWWISFVIGLCRTWNSDQWHSCYIVSFSANIKLLHCINLQYYFCQETKIIVLARMGCLYTIQKKLRVNGFLKIIFVSMASLVGVLDFFHQGNKLVSNQKCFVCEPSNNYFVISRHHFSSLAYIYMHNFVWP